MTRVRRRGFRFASMFRISSKLIFSMIGYIMISSTIATGIETFAISISPRVSAKPGKI